MTHKPDSICTSYRFLSQRSLLKGLGWIGGLSLLSSSGAVFAQAASDPLVVPSAQDLLMPAAQPEPAAPEAPASAAPEAPTRIAPVERSAPSPSPQASSEPAVPEAAAPSPKPSVAAETTDNPSISLPGSVADQVETLTPNTTANEADRANNDYIDTTDYSLGATPGYGQPSSVVLSERSTGCQAVVRQGQTIPASICPVSRPTAGNSVGRVVPVRSVRIGPVQLSANGFGIGRNYYSVTQRPGALPGNGNVQLMFPLSVPVAITSAFGWRVHPISGALRFHYGTDLGAPMGTPVVAAYTGRVAIADFMRGYGLTVVMHHNNNTAESLYAHLSEIFVQPGEWIEQGQVIGRVGSTGNSTGPHLHFEFRERTSEGWVALNPGNMLQQALANFSGNFHLAQMPSGSETLIALGFNSFEEVLKALKEDPASLKFQKAQLGESPVALDFDLEDIKDWSKAAEKASATLSSTAR